MSVVKLMNSVIFLLFIKGMLTGILGDLLA